MGWWITLGILFLLAILPLGVRVHYNADGSLVRIIAGPLKFTVIPEKAGKKKKEKKKKKPKKKAEKKKQVGASSPPAAPQKEEGGSILDFLPLVKTLFSFLGSFRRKLRINNLQLKLIMAGGDPYNLAMNYGRAWVAVGNLLPKLESWFVIRKRDIEVECDFVATQTKVIAHMDLTITLGRLLAVVVRYAIKAMIQYFKIKKKRKGGAANEPDVT